MVSVIPPKIQGRITTQGRTRTGTEQKATETTDRSYFYPPPKPNENFVPAESVIKELVSRALAAISRGIYWDRGSIVNIVL